VRLHASRTLWHDRDRPNDLLAALAAKGLTALHCGAASIAVHNCLRVVEH